MLSITLRDSSTSSYAVSGDCSDSEHVYVPDYVRGLVDHFLRYDQGLPDHRALLCF
jgi:hypothetical protein